MHINSELDVIDILKNVGAYLTDDDFVYTSKRHGAMYINKDGLYPHPLETEDVCRYITEQFKDDNVEVVVGPAIGGVILSNNIARLLTKMTGRKVLGLYAERKEESVLLPNGPGAVFIGGKKYTVDKGDEVVIKRAFFVLKRGQDKLVAGKRFLAVEDVLTTGGSARKAIDAISALGGTLVGLGVINRGGKQADDMDVPKFFGAINIKLQTYEVSECPLCKNGVPINTSIGHGRDFVAEQK
jgi:orotate phosphoribosyltransferase